MASMTLLASFLLFTGTFLVNTSAQAPFTVMVNVLSGSSASPQPSTTVHAPSNTTSDAPSNTTTDAPSNTTTHAPSNTTTNAPTNTTTHAPTNITTHAPFNTTTHATIHTTPVLPTKPSPPVIGNYTVKDGKGVCIIADMGLEIQIDISTKEKTDRKYFNIDPKQATTNGTCGDSKSNLLLQFPEGSINFTFVKESKTYYIEEVSVQFYVASAGRWNGTSGKLKLLPTDAGYFVACKRTPTVQLGDKLELILADVKLQAFDIQDGKLGKEETCSYDHNNTAVVIAIVVVVIIVLAIVVYFIWHKRRSSGYERV